MGAEAGSYIPMPHPPSVVVVLVAEVAEVAAAADNRLVVVVVVAAVDNRLVVVDNNSLGRNIVSNLMYNDLETQCLFPGSYLPNPTSDNELVLINFELPMLDMADY